MSAALSDLCGEVRFLTASEPAADAVPELSRVKIVTCGEPIGSVEARTLDATGGNAASSGKSGQVTAQVPA